MNTWYDKLKKSPITPPSWVVRTVWSILYSLMIISLIVYLSSNYTRKGLILFFCQLTINLLWAQLFFNRRMICASVVNIVFMNIFVVLTYIEFRKSSKIAANLLLPYIAWILLALYLNYYICVNN
jgi:tryptophan-rich sensory protein